MSSRKFKLSLEAKFERKVDCYAVVALAPKDQPCEKTILGKTEIVHDSQRAEWSQKFIFDCAFGTAMNIIITLFDAKNESSELAISTFDVNQLMAAAKKCVKLDRTNSGIGGKLRVSLEDRNDDFDSPDYSFLQYIHGGCNISLLVAIDFTSSNGNPRTPGTLHYIHRDGNTNDYESAIKSVADILAEYDSDKKFPVWGFGAKFKGVVSHCFQCGSKEEVDGVQGILDAYHETIRNGITMSGPSDITEIIKKAGEHAHSEQEKFESDGKQSYTVLLILTDGVVADVQKTANALDSVCQYPLSVIIIGIGTANFADMRFLDERSVGGDKYDICEFVEYNKYRHDLKALTSACLQEFPSHLEGYFTRKGIPALTLRQEEDIVVEADEEEIQL